MVRLAVVDFVLGALEILYGIYLLVGAGLLGSAVSLPEAPEVFQQAAGVLGALMLGLAFLAFAMGALMVVAGWGLLARLPWARVLTLFLAALAVLAALGSLSPLNVASLLLHAGYAALVFVALLHPRYRSAFAPAWGVIGETGTKAASGVERTARRGLGWAAVLLALGTFLVGIAVGWGVTRLAQTKNETPFQAANQPLVAMNLIAR